MKPLIKKIPVLRSLVRIFHRMKNKDLYQFNSSEEYWNSRYNSGGNSGPGSYNELAKYKAKILNRFVAENQIESVIEFGSGDGNQLKLAEYPNYLGFDVSEQAIGNCRKIFSSDSSKKFKLVADFNNEKADLVISLDVIYHLVENDIFEDYMNKLFSSAQKFVIIYSSNSNDQLGNKLAHVKHRKFTDWVETNYPSWNLVKQINNDFKFEGDSTIGSFADFYIYEVPK